MVDQLVAQALHLHRAALGKVQDGLLALGAAKQAAAAAMVGLALLAHRRTAAHRALRRHGEQHGIRQALLGQHGHHLGNHVTGAAHHHGVAHAHVLAPGLVLVVQGGIGDRHAAHKHRRQLGHRRELAGAAHLHLDRLHRGEHLLRRKFVGYGPARLARDKAHALL